MRGADVQGAYNTILAGAAFMDSATFFPLYFSSSTAPARALVDEVFNCDDLLLNFVVANWTAGQAKATGAGPAAAGGTGEGGASAMMPPVQLVRPERRIDISRLSGVGEACCTCAAAPCCVYCRPPLPNPAACTPVAPAHLAAAPRLALCCS